MTKLDGCNSPGGTHHHACACREAGWALVAATARRVCVQVDEFGRTLAAAALRQDVKELRAALESVAPEGKEVGA